MTWLIRLLIWKGNIQKQICLFFDQDRSYEMRTVLAVVDRRRSFRSQEHDSGKFRTELGC